MNMLSKDSKKDANSTDRLFNTKLSGIYHYTSIENMVHIIKDNCLFASHLKYLNDYEEYNTGYKYLYQRIKYKKNFKKFIKSEFEQLIGESPKRSDYSIFLKGSRGVTSEFYLRSILPEVYIISFCEEGDSLNNWISYAKENGVSIEFNFSGFKFYDYSLEAIRENYITKGVDEKDFYDVVNFNCVPTKIEYVNEEDLNLKEKFTNLVNEYANKYQDDLDTEQRIPDFWYWLVSLCNLVPFMKTHEFTYEQEVRIAVRGSGEKFDTSKGTKEAITNIVHYRVKNNVIIPYMKVGWKKSDETNSLPIKSITIGPGKNQQAIFESVVQFIEGLDNKVIPFEKNAFGDYFSNEEEEEKRKLKNTDNPGDQNENGKTYITNSGITIKCSKVPYIF